MRISNTTIDSNEPTDKENERSKQFNNLINESDSKIKNI
jgi:hypothetical protein